MGQYRDVDQVIEFGQNDHWEDTSQFRNHSSFGIKLETKVSKSIDAT